MARSRKTLDIDSLTYENIYIKGQSGSQISSYTIPVIPGNNVIKQLQYFTPHQALSVGNIYITESTIPNILTSISTLSINQYLLGKSLCTLSTTLGHDISSIQSTTNIFLSSAHGYTYGSTYSTLVGEYNTVQIQNISTLNFEGIVLNLGQAFSTISSQYSPDFSNLSITLERNFNQGPSVSSLSTYFTQYFNGLTQSIPIYSSNINASISTATSQNTSSLISYINIIVSDINSSKTLEISSLSTIITSTFTSYFQRLNSYNTSASISSISTNVGKTLLNYSTNFAINSGVSGICSISTNIALNYAYALSNLQIIAGTPGLSSMSTVFTREIISIGQSLNFTNQTNTVYNLSTLLENQINNITNVVSSVGYINTILQQQRLKDSISTLSTTFGKDYINITSLSSFSSLLPSVYSTINTVFSLQGPYSTINSMSTLYSSTLTYYLNYIVNSYTQIFTGPGLSSLSTTIGPGFSSISSSVDGIFRSFSNALGIVSSVRADPGICTLSTYITTNINLYSNLYNDLYLSTNLLLASNAYNLNLLSNISTTNSINYNINNPTNTFGPLINDINKLNTYITTGLNPIIQNVSTLSSILQRQLVSSYVGVQSTSILVINQLISSYNNISSILENNIYSPVFSSFTTDLLTTSTLIVTNNIVASSIGLNQSTTNEYPFSMVGGARFGSVTPPSINHIKLCLEKTGNTIFTSSDGIGIWSSNISGQYTGQGNAAAYNGLLWVTVGSNLSGTGFIKYTDNIGGILSNASYPNINQTLRQINTVKWNGSYWLAGGSGDYILDPTLLKSSNGIDWLIARQDKKLDSYYDLAWNGYNWVAVGSDSTGSNILYTDINGIWNQAINSFDIQANAVTNNGRTWVAVGKGSVTIKYSYNSINWEDVIGPQLSTATCVAWNGDKFLVGGSNGNTSNLMYSYNGVNWSYVPVSTNPNTYISQQVTSILWDGTLWSAAGINNITSNNGINIVSKDAISWSNINITSGIIYGQAYASNTRPAIQLSNFDIYSGEIPSMMNSRKRMNIIQSNIYFNDGDFTIRRQISSIPVSHIGINTPYPEYALDIAIGNARKVVGTTWLTASDERVKTDIISADLISCAKIISLIPLRQYSFNNEFQKKTGTSSQSQYGFIAQEVKEILPDAVRYTKEYGLDDFHSLDTDQIFKLEFGATQYLLQKIEKMEQQVSTLELKYKKIYKS